MSAPAPKTGGHSIWRPAPTPPPSPNLYPGLTMDEVQKSELVNLVVMVQRAAADFRANPACTIEHSHKLEGRVRSVKIAPTEEGYTCEARGFTLLQKDTRERLVQTMARELAKVGARQISPLTQSLRAAVTFEFGRPR